MYHVTVKGLLCVHKNMINRQRDTIFAPNIKMRVDTYYINYNIFFPCFNHLYI